MKKLNKKHMLIFGISIIVVIFIIVFLFMPKKVLELKGESTETIALNSVYNDPGVNLKEAHKIGDIDTSHEGTYTIVYTYNNQKVTRTVKVIDNHRVIMNINGSVDTYVKCGDPYIESGCHVIDKKDGNLTSKVKQEGSVNSNLVGDYSIIYTVTNSEGLVVKRERRVHVVDSEDFLEGKISLPKRSVILTFDDAQKGFLKYGIPLLEKYKVPATSFVIGSKDGGMKVKEYASEYISFQSHSYDMHCGGGNIGHGGIVSSLKTDEIVDDLKRAQSVVQNTEAFAYPYGDVTENSQKAINETGILCAFTTQHGKVKKGMDLTALPRVRVIGTGTLKAFIASMK